MFDIEDNFTTNGSDGNYSDGYEREDFPLINLYLALPLRVIMSLAIITSASIVLLAIKKSKRPTTKALDFFFIANLMIADIAFAVLRNGSVIVNLTLTIINPMTEGMDCRIIAVTGFPHSMNPTMLAAMCFDRLYGIVAPHHYRRNMTKRKGYVIVSTIWLTTFLLSFLSFIDPHLSRTKARASICRTPLLKNYGLVFFTLPLFISALFVVVQNFYLYCVVVKTATKYDVNRNNSTLAAGMLRTLKETKKASTILSIISGVSIMFGIIQPATTAIIQRQAGHAQFKAIWFALIINFAYNFNILLHSVLYGYFLHSIRESLGLNIC